MRELSDANELRHYLGAQRCAGRSIGLVPTMGFLHKGHLGLVAAARAENDVVVMSIFVNPTQFGAGEDLARYPRDLEHDRRLADEAGVDVLFVPSDDVMYPYGPARQMAWIEPGSLAGQLEGASRPGHFRGVATVVAKLFNMVAADRAYFGQKDAQQAIIVERMARDLAFPITIRTIPTVRERDGLAMSSRNVYLSPEERAQAPMLWRALSEARSLIVRGERDPRHIEAAVRASIEREAPSARVQYVTVADARTLQPADTVAGDILVSLAAFFGSTRLIDNIMVRADELGESD